MRTSGLVLLTCLFGLLFVSSCQAQLGTVYDFVHTTPGFNYIDNIISMDTNLVNLLNSSDVKLTFIAYDDSVFATSRTITADNLKYGTLLTNLTTFTNGSLHNTGLNVSTLGGESQKIVVTGVTATTFQLNNFPELTIKYDDQHRQERDNGVIYIVSNDTQRPIPVPTSAYDTLKNDPQYSLFLTILARHDTANAIRTILSSSSRITVFAPNNNAFLENPLLVEYLNSTNEDEALNILDAHIVDNTVIYSTDVPTTFGEPLTVTNNYATINITRYPEQVVVSTKTSNATVSSFDTITSNGVIISIDHFLFPDNFQFSLGAALQGLDEARTLFNLVSQTKNVYDLLKLSVNANMTLFAPNDEAFFNMTPTLNETLHRISPNNYSFALQQLLYYHVLPHIALSYPSVVASGNPHQLYRTGYYEPGIANYQYVSVQLSTDQYNRSRISINNGMIITSDLKASNGLIQVINAVLTPPRNMSTLIETVQKATIDQFYGITAELLADTTVPQDYLASGANLTLLIPINTAWEVLPAGILNYLQDHDEGKAATTTILKEHVLQNALLYTVSIPVTATNYTNLNGNPVQVRYDTTKHQVQINNNIDMVGPYVNLLYSNGVAQLIDTVIIPPTIYSSIFTTQNALTGLSCNNLILILNKIGYNYLIASNTSYNYTILAANDTAWAKYITGYSDDQLRQLVKVNIITQKITNINVGGTNGSGDYETMEAGFKIRFGPGPTDVSMVSPTGEVSQKGSVVGGNGGDGGVGVLSDGSVIAVDTVFAVEFNHGGDGDGKQLSAGIIVLIVFLVVFGVVGIALAGFFGFRYYKKRGQYEVIS